MQTPLADPLPGAYLRLRRRRHQGNDDPAVGGQRASQGVGVVVQAGRRVRERFAVEIHGGEVEDSRAQVVAGAHEDRGTPRVRAGALDEEVEQTVLPQPAHAYLLGGGPAGEFLRVDRGRRVESLGQELGAHGEQLRAARLREARDPQRQLRESAAQGLGVARRGDQGPRHRIGHHDLDAAQPGEALDVAAEQIRRPGHTVGRRQERIEIDDGRPPLGRGLDGNHVPRLAAVAHLEVGGPEVLGGAPGRFAAAQAFEIEVDHHVDRRHPLFAGEEGVGIVVKLRICRDLSVGREREKERDGGRFEAHVHKPMVRKGVDPVANGYGCDRSEPRGGRSEVGQAAPAARHQLIGRRSLPYSGAPVDFRLRTTRTRVPRSPRRPISIEPPCASTMRWQRLSPSP